MAVAPDGNAPAPTPATDDADGASLSPFRRFPWVQLVFCLACLTMTAWTWMRYSYAWEVPASEFLGDPAYHPQHGGPIYALRGRFVEVQDQAGQDVRRGHILPGVNPYLDDVGLRDFVRFEHHVPPFVVVAHVGQGAQATSLRRWRGRAVLVDSFSARHFILAVDMTRSRFHGASVAGIVVGAMGAFVFGLHLRRWLVERKADFTTETQTAQRTT